MGEIFMFKQELQDMSNSEFEHHVYGLLLHNNKFQNPKKISGGYDALYDLSAEEKLSDTESVLAAFQIKRGNLLTPDAIANIYDYWRSLNIKKPDKLYMVTDGEVKEEAQKLAVNYGIGIWDIYKLYKLTYPHKYTAKVIPPSVILPETREESLSRALLELKPGKEEWATYQQLACDIFTHLFCPPLATARFEHTDADQRNRRDMIFENSNDHMYWQMLRQLYKADYIVVDAKNYNDPLDKHPIIEIAHYLKPYGCGMFGIILSRKGCGDAAKHATKEQWIGNNKMIVTLNDTDLLDMIRMKGSNSKPEELIQMKIADFRMSL